MIKEYEPTVPGCQLLLWLERTVTPGWGVAGGRSGRTARCLIDPGGPEEITLKKTNYIPIAPGITVRCHTAGGGGYGPPRGRDVQMVLDDLIDGYISREAAEGEYGLRFNGSGLVVDEAATQRTRAALAEAA